MDNRQAEWVTWCARSEVSSFLTKTTFLLVFGANRTEVHIDRSSLELPLQRADLDILEAMLLLENEKVHLGWKISDLARASGVSRALVYYHFGKTKREILDTGIELLAVELASAFPKLAKEQIRALHGILYGVVTAPFLTDEAIDIIRALVRHF